MKLLLALIPLAQSASLSTSSTSSTQQSLHISDLIAFGRTSTSDINNFYYNKYSSYPDGWCINEDTYGQAASWNGQTLCQVYNYDAYKNLGQQVNKDSFTQKQITISQSTIKNCGNSYSTRSISLSGSTGYSAAISMSSTFGLSWKGYVDLKFTAPNGLTFYASSSIGSSGSSSGSSSASASTTISVPPKKQVTVQLVATQYSGTVDYSIPVTTSGYLYGNFQNTVCYNGSCANLWYDDITKAVNNNKAEIYGIADVSASGNAQMVVGSFVSANC